MRRSNFAISCHDRHMAIRWTCSSSTHIRWPGTPGSISKATPSPPANPTGTAAATVPAAEGFAAAALTSITIGNNKGPITHAGNERQVSQQNTAEQSCSAFMIVFRTARRGQPGGNVPWLRYQPMQLETSQKAVFLPSSTSRRTDSLGASQALGKMSERTNERTPTATDGLVRTSANILNPVAQLASVSRRRPKFGLRKSLARRNDSTSGSDTLPWPWAQSPSGERAPSPESKTQSLSGTLMNRSVALSLALFVTLPGCMILWRDKRGNLQQKGSWSILPVNSVIIASAPAVSRTPSGTPPSWSLEAQDRNGRPIQACPADAGDHGRDDAVNASLGQDHIVKQQAGRALATLWPCVVGEDTYRSTTGGRETRRWPKLLNVSKLSWVRLEFPPAPGALDAGSRTRVSRRWSRCDLLTAARNGTRCGNRYTYAYHAALETLHAPGTAQARLSVEKSDLPENGRAFPSMLCDQFMSKEGGSSSFKARESKDRFKRSKIGEMPAVNSKRRESLNGKKENRETSRRNAPFPSRRQLTRTHRSGGFSWHGSGPAYTAPSCYTTEHIRFGD
ncbi:hypothetical protein CSOJ01_02824 [Colletotrichum sojae]|uniref:Uncharacterized protein n=1 Tax=Colletotrichum sojae TaxID=2175907 RepID=A0A8H6N193_9PEZI|nr:hypothetical protein CSOJ01_02824 [Colletotrichum sojae]